MKVEVQNDCIVYAERVMAPRQVFGRIVGRIKLIRKLLNMPRFAVPARVENASVINSEGFFRLITSHGGLT